MKSILVLNRVKVENANAIAGMTYGFPAVTHFLGYVHALSRELCAEFSIELGGCGIMCHDFKVQAYKTSGWGDQVFSLTKNPLCKDGSTASFNEEGKVHMEISLIIECDFTGDDFDFGTDDIKLDIKKFEEWFYLRAVKRRVAGGIITSISSVKFYEIPQAEDQIQTFFKTLFRKMLPGFVLQDRKEIFKNYLVSNLDRNPFDALLDFYVLKSKALPPDGEAADNRKVEWELMPKPAGGWLVPIQVGYKAISPLYNEGEVACVRDRTVPVRFVEPIYGLGEWLGLHRIQKPEAIFWDYHHDNDMYLCLNKFN